MVREMKAFQPKPVIMPDVVMQLFHTHEAVQEHRAEPWNPRGIYRLVLANCSFNLFVHADCCEWLLW